MLKYLMASEGFCCGVCSRASLDCLYAPCAERSSSSSHRALSAYSPKYAEQYFEGVLLILLLEFYQSLFFRCRQSPAVKLSLILFFCFVLY